MKLNNEIHIVIYNLAKSSIQNITNLIINKSMFIFYPLPFYDLLNSLEIAIYIMTFEETIYQS